MGMLDKVKGLVKGREDQISRAADKVGAEINKRTDGKHADKIASARDKLDDTLGRPAEARPATASTPPVPPPPTDPPPTPGPIDPPPAPAPTDPPPPAPVDPPPPAPQWDDRRDS
ncbi:hypothetical protein BH20ACT5_BH20ACT5_12770 [soil metagenome]